MLKIRVNSFHSNSSSSNPPFLSHTIVVLNHHHLWVVLILRGLVSNICRNTLALDLINSWRKLLLSLESFLSFCRVWWLLVLSSLICFLLFFSFVIEGLTMENIGNPMQCTGEESFFFWGLLLNFWLNFWL